MKCAKCNTEFHEDHGCGTAVLCGSSYAQHSLECPLNPFGLLMVPAVQEFVANMHGKKLGLRPWEAPAGECPVCYHGDFRTAAMGATEKMKERS